LLTGVIALMQAFGPAHIEIEEEDAA